MNFTWCVAWAKEVEWNGGLSDVSTLRRVSGLAIKSLTKTGRKYRGWSRWRRSPQKSWCGMVTKWQGHSTKNWSFCCRWSRFRQVEVDTAKNRKRTNARWVLIICHNVCNRGSDQSDRRINVARFCDLTCTLNFGQELPSPALNQLIRPMWDCKPPPYGWYLQSQLYMAESFCRFLELKTFLFKFYFRAFIVRVEYRLHDDKHNLSWLLGQFGCILARHHNPRACGPQSAVAGRDLAILPQQIGEVV